MPKGTKHGGGLFLRGGTVLNVYSGELLKMDIRTKEDIIWYVGPLSDVSEKETVVDVGGRILVPGYIEPHTHALNLYNPITLGEAACRSGTTTLFCDNLLAHLLMGVDNFEAFVDELSRMPIKYYWFCRSAPQTPMAREDEIYALNNLKRLLNNDAIQSLGEVTRWPELLTKNPHIMEIIRYTKGLKKRIDGHTAGAKYEKLNILSRAGIESCHESINAQEVLERLRLGIYVMLRESSLRPDLRNLLSALTEKDVLTDRMMLTTDGSSPEFYQQFGFTDNLIKIALEEGIDPIWAYRMSTINPAVYFGLNHKIGGIGPGRDADILVLKDLHHPTPEMVISKGRIVAENGRLLKPFPHLRWEKYLPANSLSPRPWEARMDFFKIPCQERKVSFPTIKLINAVITRHEWVDFKTRNGYLTLANRDGYCYLSLISRDGKWVTNGILQGFGDAVEGMASSFNTALEILVIGRKPQAMSAAVNRVLEMGGGIVAVERGEVAYELPLPLGGIMSTESMESLAKKDNELKAFLIRRGYPFNDPVYTFTFLPNDFLPQVRVNYKGVFDIVNNKMLWPRRELGV